MKVFICWSGARSKAFAEILQSWFPKVLGATIKPIVSMDISKGAVWFEELNTLLADARAGVICVTPEALHSPWIHYEAGVLTKALGDTRTEFTKRKHLHPIRLFTFLHGVEVSELQGPLAAFQSTSAQNPEDTQRLLQTMVDLMPKQVQGAVPRWEQQFQGLWDDFQKNLRNIPPAQLETVFPDLGNLFKRKTFYEPLRDCVNQNWLARYDGIRETLNKVREQREQVRRVCSSFIIGVYDALIEELSSYAVATSLLLKKNHFPVNENGHVQIEPSGLAKACERRRLHVKALLSDLLDPREAPVLEDAFYFEHLQTSTERKNLIHRKTVELEQTLKDGGDWISTEQLTTMKMSNWNFDRIMYYVHQKKQPKHTIAEALQDAFRELEKIRARGKASSFMTLHYSLSPLIGTIGIPNRVDTEDSTSDLEKLTKEIRKLMEGTQADKGGQIRSTLGEIEQLLAKQQ
ncbi:MAG: toll/interleukin-1 receptor domain-containing protein [Nitrospira sp.]|nr:toll/interleukin-1 receptor domain-containing protein [Nitrospira sp.]